MFLCYFQSLYLLKKRISCYIYREANRLLPRGRSAFECLQLQDILVTIYDSWFLFINLDMRLYMILLWNHSLKSHCSLYKNEEVNSTGHYFISSSFIGIRSRSNLLIFASTILYFFMTFQFEHEFDMKIIKWKVHMHIYAETAFTGANVSRFLTYTLYSREFHSQ